MTLPDTKLAAVAREMGVKAHTLVAAWRKGRFCALIQVGRTWMLRRADLAAWIARQEHGPAQVSPMVLDRIRAAGASAARQPGPRRRQQRADTASSS